MGMIQYKLDITVDEEPSQFVVSTFHETESEFEISIMYAEIASPFELGADQAILIPPVVASIDVVGVST